jgi:hypothetical protein
MSDQDNVTPINRRKRTPPAQRAAQSLYGQIRLTVTFEPNGRAHWRALAKRPQDDWRELNVFSTGYEEFAEYPPTISDALEMFGLIAEHLRWQPEPRL